MLSHFLSLVACQSTIEIDSPLFVNASAHSYLLESRDSFAIRWKDTHAKVLSAGLFYIDEDVSIAPPADGARARVALQPLPKGVCSNRPRAAVFADLRMVLSLDFDFSTELIDSVCLFSQLRGAAYFTAVEHIVSSGNCSVEYYSQPKRSDAMQLTARHSGNGTEKSTFHSPFLVRLSDCSGALSLDMRYSVVRNSFERVGCALQQVSALHENGAELRIEEFSHLGFCERQMDSFVSTAFFVLSVALSALLLFTLFCCAAPKRTIGVL